MNDRHLVAGEQRLQDYLSQLADVLGHADRKGRLVGYCIGLLLPGERKGTVNLLTEGREGWNAADPTRQRRQR